MTDAVEARTYGNWRRPQSAGLGGFGMLGTGVIFGGLIFTIIGFKLFGLIGAGVTVIPAAVTLLMLSRKDKHGFNWGQRVLVRFASARSKRRGSHLYRSGPLGRTLWGRYQLPGISARSRLWEAADSYGRPFALLHMPTTNHYTVVIECQPDGAALVDQHQVDQWVAGWGQYLARLGGEPGIEGASVVVETAPDSGTKLDREVELHIDESAHALAKAMLRETARTYPSNSSDIRAWITVTLKGVTPAGKRRSTEDIARDLQAKMPNWVSSVATTGGGAAHPVSAAELCEIIRTAYDPGCAELIEEAHARGDEVELDWSDVGPVAHETFHDAYRHDGAWSVTWAMTQPPRGLSYSDLLMRLLSPHAAVDRKRVTLLYRPVEPGVAAGIVEADKRNSDFRVSAQSRPTARALTDQKAAHAAAQEEAKGAGLTNFGMLVTATVFDKEGLAEAKAAINNLGAGARILLRPQYGSQDSAFAAGLPLGLIVSKHLKVPAIVREAAGVSTTISAAPADAGADNGPRRVVSLRRVSEPTPDTEKEPKLPRKERKRLAAEAARLRPRRPGPRGWVGRGRGTAELVQAAGEWRGTTVQVCGMWPFAAGTGAPLTGVPLGPHLQTGATVCGDPISWFMRAKLISNPSMFALGKPGLGKSTLIRRMLLGLEGYGVLPMVLADLKPDYVDLIRALDGQVIQLGRATGGLNVLDPGEATEVAARLTGAAREAVLIEAHARKVELLKAFISIVRKTPVQVEEGNVLARAVNILDDRARGTVPLLRDLMGLVHQAPDELRVVANDRGDIGRYHDIVRQLEASLFAMCSPDGPIGDVFARPTAVLMRRDKPVCIDVSSIRDTEADLQGAALLACWSAGFASVNYHHLLADAGLERQRHFFLVMDELWRALRSGPEMVDRIDGLTRLNRQTGVGQAFCTHTMSDLLSLSSEAERTKAFGFVERAGMVVTAGLPEKELPLLSQAGVNLSRREGQMVTEWSAPATFDVRTGREGDPPGRGKFLIKVGSRPGIPVKVTLTQAELKLNDTNKRWK